MNDMAKALSRKVTIYINGKEVESTIKSLTSEMDKLKKQQRGMIIGSEEYIKTSLKIKEIDGVLKAQKAAIQSVGESWEDTRKAVADYSTILYGLKVATSKIAGAYNWAKGYVEEAARMDDAYADVMKTTGLTHDEVLRLNEAFKQMDTRTAREELNKLASEAGKLGITGVDAVASFTAAADKIRVALGEDLGEDATTVIGKMADVYTRSTKELSDAGDDLGAKMLRIGSAINSLGAASSAAEPHMVDFLARLGGMASQAGLSAQQVLGYASALDQSGVSVEKSATAFQNFMAKMMQKPAEFAAIARQGVAEFRQLMETDMDAAIKAVLAGLNEEGGMTKLAPLFKDLQLSGQGVTTMLTTLKGSIDKVNEAQTIANAQMSSGASIEDEFAVKNNTLQAQMEKAKDKFHDTAETLGNALYPAIIGVTNAGSGLMSGFASLAKFVNGNRWILLSFTTALIALSYAKLKNIAADKLVAVQKRLNNTLTKTGTGLTKLHTAAQDRATLASLKLQKAKIALASSNKTVSYTIDGVRISSDKMTAARNIDLAITRQQTVANKSLGVAMKAVPWGWVITAVSVLAPLMYKLFTHQSKVNEAEKEAARQYGEAEGKLRVLKERMIGAKEGSAEYLEALNELKSEYPDIIQLHLDEKGAIRDLEAAYKDLSAAARQSAYDRVYAEKTSEAYGELAETVADVTSHLQDVIVNRIQWKKSPSEAVKEELRKFVTEQVRLISEGKKGVQKALDDIDEFVGKFGGKISRLHGDLGKSPYARTRSELVEVASAYRETEETVKKYKDALKPDKTEEDPYGYAKMSLEELEKELASATSSMNDMKRQWELWKKEAPDNPNTKTLGENYLHEKKRVEQLTAAIVRLRKVQGESGSGGNGGGGTYGSGESEKERKARERAEAREAKRIADAWKKAQKDAKKMTDKFNLQAESGLQRVKDDVDAKTEEMIARLRETAEEAGESADDLEKELREAAENYKESQVAEYLNKVTAEVDKLKKATAKSEDGERLNKVSRAVENLRQQLNSIDELLKKLKSDLGQSDKGSDTYNRLQAEIKRLEAIKKDAVSAAFSSMDFKVENPFKELSQFSLKDNQARAIDEVKKKVEEYAEALGDAEAAYRKMAETARLEGNEDKAKEYEAQADALKKQADALDEISDKARELAKQNALKKTLDTWCDGIERFTDQALSIFSNINSLLDNIADSELQKMERQKDAAIENLDEQLEQGLISQEQYEEQKKTLEDDYAEKEKEVKLEQWRRQKALDLTQAIIGGALAAVRAYAEGGPYAGPILAAMIAAATGIQIAAIENQPEPYAKGGYVPRRTVYQAGEAGPEWVASNTLLSDPATAPIIEALESYQRGNRRALADIPMAQIDMPVATAAARELGRRTVGAMENTLLSMPTATQKFDVNMPDSGEMMKLWQELATYLKDPNNRRAVISRQTMTDFEKNEQFLRNKARL